MPVLSLSKDRRSSPRRRYRIRPRRRRPAPGEASPAPHPLADPRKHAQRIEELGTPGKGGIGLGDSLPTDAPGASGRWFTRRREGAEKLVTLTVIMCP